MQRFILTGGPGFGKTSILEHLQELGFNTFEEVARQVIKEELLAGSDVLPWKNLDAFSKKVLPLQIFNHSKALPGINFYDRAIPDIAAYQVHGQQVVFAALQRAIMQHRYNSKVFITPPWPEIYNTDNERQETYEKACTIHAQLMQTYQHFNYDVTEVPTLKVADRVQFILQNIHG